MSERDTTIPATAALLDGWVGAVIVAYPDAEPVDAVRVRRWGDGSASVVCCGDSLSNVSNACIRLDLTIPAVRDRVARVMAEALGVPVGATAPGWVRQTLSGDWLLVGDGWPVGGAWACFTSGLWLANGDPRGDHFHTVPGISEVTDPIVSLALAWRAVCGGGE